MGKRIEMDLTEKEKLIQKCLAGRIRMREAARRAGVGHSTMHTWISRYRAEGVSALSENGNAQRRRYSEEIRQKAVKEYLSGRGQRYGHRGKVQAALREPCAGLGKGVSSS